jgi:hypothetical protein
MPRCADTTCRRWRLFGALQFNGDWYCSRACVEQAALAGLTVPEDGARTSGTRALPPLKLGVLLRHAGAITEAQLDAALTAKARTGLRIGEQLEQMGLASADTVLRALATQAGVSYLSNFDVARVRRAPSALTPAIVRALGLVPFEADQIGQRLHVISAAPLPRTAIRAMTKLTGWSIEVYLVKDAVFDAALDAYQPAGQMEVAEDTSTVRTLDAAAARIAERAARDRAITVRHVAYDDGSRTSGSRASGSRASYVWVRVEGSERISDLLIEKETECPAAYTAH